MLEHFYNSRSMDGRAREDLAQALSYFPPFSGRHIREDHAKALKNPLLKVFKELIVDVPPHVEYDYRWGMLDRRQKFPLHFEEMIELLAMESQLDPQVSALVRYVAKYEFFHEEPQGPTQNPPITGTLPASPPSFQASFRQMSFDEKARTVSFERKSQNHSTDIHVASRRSESLASPSKDDKEGSSAQLHSASTKTRKVSVEIGKHPRDRKSVV